MFLRSTTRYKDGKNHRYFSVVENRRVRDGRSVQKTLLYLGEINDSQRAGWVKAIEVVEGKRNRQMSLFPNDSAVPEGVENGIQLVMNALELSRPRQWGACWLARSIRGQTFILHRMQDSSVCKCISSNKT